MIKLTDDLKKLTLNDFRDAAFNPIIEIFKNDKNAFLLTNDMGAMGLDKISKFASNRVINVGITEQNMVSVAAGLALSGKTVFVYGILSHIVFRALEQIKLDVCVQNLSVIFICVGSGLAYGVDGPTHQGIEDISVLRSLPNLTIFNPADSYSTSEAINLSYKSSSPCIVRIDKEVLPSLYKSKIDLQKGILSHQHVEKSKIIIFTTGVVLWNALKAQEELKELGTDVRVVDIFKIKPLNSHLLIKYAQDVTHILVVEESLSLGSLSELVAKTLISHVNLKSFVSIDLGDKFILGSAKREWAWQKFGLEYKNIVNQVKFFSDD